MVSEVYYEVHMTRVLLTGSAMSIAGVTFVDLSYSIYILRHFMIYRYYGITVMHAPFPKPDGKHSGLT